jgi:hypothetical protein
MAWNQGYSDKENLQWSLLRAVEWGIWPAFLSQPIVSVLLMFFEWWGGHRRSYYFDSTVVFRPVQIRQCSFGVSAPPPS